MQLGLEHSYAQLPAAFFTRTPPTPVASPSLLAWNETLAGELGLDSDALRPVAQDIFSGNHLPSDAQPIAMAYAGHQYAHFVPALGDGRAILLGELRDRHGILRDLQLKGAGRTPWSRSGDGRAAVGPMLREYLVSEAMHALGIPTTRSLAVIATGERVLREEPLPGAILTRVAASHIRVGTFEYFAARGDTASLTALLQYTLHRHYPAQADAADPAMQLLVAVASRQAELIAAWMCVGFVHGVMNTDNMALSGETIDFGPCAFMDHYDPRTVFSSIDHRGRYSYGNQPAIAQWNLARLAECLLPLMPGDTEQNVTQATEVVREFMAAFDAAFLQRMRGKLGLQTTQPDDAALVQDLLQTMRNSRADFTLTFRQLEQFVEPPSAAQLAALTEDWLERWRRRLAAEPLDPTLRRAAMLRTSPLYIPRNHQVEAALAAASQRGDMEPFRTLLELLQHPFEERSGFERFTQPAADHERVMQTFCGT